MKEKKEIFFAGAFYEVAETKRFPHGKMIGIYDEPPSKHIDYLHPSSVHNVENCNSCQGCGCTACNGYGKIVGALMSNK